MPETNETRPGGSSDGSEAKQISTSSIALTASQAEALAIAHELVDAGIPVFAAPRNHSAELADRMPFILPNAWQTYRARHDAVDRWRPGWALCAVTGVGMDVIDTDPQNGGEVGRAELEAAGVMPPVFGVAETPSSGRHELIPRTHLAKGVPAQGVDFQAGDDRGEGRAFIFIAPTVRVSKHGPNKGRPVEYRWSMKPDLEGLKAAETPAALIERIGAAKPAQQIEPTVRAPVPTSDAWDEAEDWTPAGADRVIADQLARVRAARAGQINSTLGGAARMLGRFAYGGYLNEGDAFSALMTAVEAGGVHSDDWNKRNGLSWTAKSVIFSAFSRAHSEPITVGLAAEVGNEWMDTPRGGDEARAVLGDKSARERLMMANPANRKAALDKLRDRLLTLDQLRNLPPAESLIKGVLTMDSAVWLIGQAGGFKSFVALDWAAHVATGRTWNGTHKVRKGKVLYLVAEGVRGFMRRIDAWTQHHGEKPEDLMVLPVPVQAAGDDGVSAGWGILVELASELEPALIVLDTQARLTVGLEENSNTEMGIWISAVDKLKSATGACVLVVHHTGRNGGDARGASALDGAQDAEWKVTRKEHELAFTLACDKNKDGDDSARWDFGMAVKVVGVDEDGEEITSLAIGAALEADRRTAVREVELTAEEGRALSARQIVTRVLDEMDEHRDGLPLAVIVTAVNRARKSAGQDAYKSESIRATLNRLRGDGVVARNGAQYALTWAREGATEGA